MSALKPLCLVFAASFLLFPLSTFAEGGECIGCENGVVCSIGSYSLSCNDGSQCRLWEGPGPDEESFDCEDGSSGSWSCSGMMGDYGCDNHTRCHSPVSCPDKPLNPCTIGPSVAPTRFAMKIGGWRFHSNSQDDISIHCSSSDSDASPYLKEAEIDYDKDTNGQVKAFVLLKKKDGEFIPNPVTSNIPYGGESEIDCNNESRQLEAWLDMGDMGNMDAFIDLNQSKPGSQLFSGRISIPQGRLEVSCKATKGR